MISKGLNQPSTNPVIMKLTKDEVKFIINGVIHDWVIDTAKEDRSFEEYDYGFNDGMRHLKSMLIDVVNAIEEEQEA